MSRANPEFYEGDDQAMEVKVAEFNEGAWTENKGPFDRLYIGFQVASAGLGAEVVLWLIDLGTR